MKRDRLEGQVLPLGIHWGRVLAHGRRTDTYWCFRLPIPFTEHHRLSWSLYANTMQQLHFGAYRTGRNGWIIGFGWVELPEYDYCSASIEETA